MTGPMKKLVDSNRQIYKGWHVETRYYDELFLDETVRGEETTIRPGEAVRRQMPSGSRYSSTFSRVADAFDTIDQLNHQFQIVLSDV